MGSKETAAILSRIQEESSTDVRLRRLLEASQEYAGIYLLAAHRKKGCDGMGELAMVKEEFKESLDDLFTYCIEKGFLAEDIQSDVDAIAYELGANEQG